MICMPGLTWVDFRAMSVRRLISMPGATSMYSEASPGSGRKPCATVPRNAAYCGWRLSRKQNALSSIPATGGPSLSGHDLDPRRRADPGGPGGDHLLDVVPRPDPARGLDAHPGPHRLAHERDVEHGGAARRVARAGLHEVGLCLLGKAARDDLLAVVEQRGLEDHLVDRARLVARVGDPRDVVADDVVHPRLERADVDDHVDLARPGADDLARLVGLDLRRRGPEGEADDAGHGDPAALEVRRGPRDPERVDADAGKPV